jgi:hypothetical protein
MSSTLAGWLQVGLLVAALHTEPGMGYRYQPDQDQAVLDGSVRGRERVSPQAAAGREPSAAAESRRRMTRVPLADDGKSDQGEHDGHPDHDRG